MVPRNARSLAASALAAWAVAFPAHTQPAGQLDPLKLAHLKAGYLHWMAHVTEWPSPAEGSEGDSPAAPEPMQVCVLGRDPHGVADVFESASQRARLEAQRRPLALERLAYVPDATTDATTDAATDAEMDAGAPAREARRAFEASLARCHVLFVTASEAPHWSELHAWVADRPVLTLGEFPGFARAGGVLEFWVDAEQRELEYRVNLAAAERAGLRLAPALLRIEQVRIVQDDRKRSGRRERMRAGYGSGRR